MSGFLYIIGATGRKDERHFVPAKIGITKNFTQRLADLQAGCPDILAAIILVEVDDPKFHEEYVHNLFVNNSAPEVRKQHIHREWFLVRPEQIDIILQLVAYYDRDAVLREDYRKLWWPEVDWSNAPSFEEYKDDSNELDENSQRPE